MDPAQIILLIVISALTILLIFIGVQIFFVLKELRQAFVKVNRILDEAQSIADSVMEPISNFSSAFSGIKAVASLLSMFSHKKSKKEDEK